MIHVGPAAIWEADVPNGEYEVRIVAGDPSWPSGTPAVQVEGISALSGEPLSSNNKWIDNTVQVTISDSKLTLSFEDSNPLTKLCWISIHSL